MAVESQDASVVDIPTSYRTLAQKAAERVQEVMASSDQLEIELDALLNEIAQLGASGN